MKWQQQVIDIPISDSVKPSKPFIPDNFNNRMELKKLERKKYFTKSLLDLRSSGFSGEEVSSCANITDSVEKLIVWHKVLTTYR